MSYQLTDGIRKSIRIRETQQINIVILPCLLNLLFALIFLSQCPFLYSLHIFSKFKDIYLCFSDAFGDPSSQLMDLGMRIDSSLIAFRCRCSFFTSSSCTTQSIFLLFLFRFSTSLSLTLCLTLFLFFNFFWGLLGFSILFPISTFARCSFSFFINHAQRFVF